ncbi:MAG TPA: ATP-binding protein [Bryobacteraceae bacterium]|nr:ATP-binding protein [Bryobacteraceae bacterium]
MFTSLRLRLYLTCFLLIACMMAIVDLARSMPIIVLILIEVILCAAAAAVMTSIFSGAIAWRIERLRAFTDNLLEASRPGLLLPEEDDTARALNQSLRRMADRIHELVESLSHESHRLDAILKSMGEGVLAVDRQMRVQFTNLALERAMGLTSPVERDTPVVDVVREPAFLSLISDVISTGAPATRRLQFSGRGAIFQAHASPYAVAPHGGALMILHDITDIERLERVRRDFVANVSHELKTPLAAIRGYAETLLGGALDDASHNRRFVEIIQAQAIRLNNIATDLLTLSDLESGKPDAEPGPVSVEDAVDTALATVETEARVRGVKLIRGAVHDALVTGHAIRLEQALVNLLDNAVKFNKPGGEVRIDAAPREGKIVISIADTGAGIPSSDVSRIFERFYRVDRARSREVGGTGLGLSIVKHVVERMDGTIAVESKLGEGSTFTISLPLRPGNGETESRAA